MGTLADPGLGDWEYDAPQFFDFTRLTGEGAKENESPRASLWFDASAGTSLRSPLSEVRNRPCSSLFDGVPASTVKQVQGQQNPVEPPSSKPAGTSTRKRNIVTAWGNNEKSVQPSAAAQQQPGKQPGTSSLPANASTTVPVSSARPTATARKAPLAADLSTAGPSGQGAKEEASMRVTRSATKAKQVKASMTAKTLKAAMANARAARSRKATHAGAAGQPSGPKVQVPAPQAGAVKARTSMPRIATRPAAARPRQAPGLKSAQPGRLAAAPAQGRATAAGVRRTSAGKQQPSGSGVAKVAAAARLKRVLQPKKVMPNRSTKPLTLPEEPELRVNKRARIHCSEAEQGGSKTPFKPLAAKVLEFQKKTPGRFKSRAPPPEPSRPLAMTQPKEPLLLTAVRTRPSHFKPRELREEEELASIPKFHARPLNPEVLHSRPIQEHKPLPPPTQPQPFHFVSDLRGERRRRQQEEEEEAAAGGHHAEPHFRAKPLRRSILEAPAELPKKPRMSLTVPKSPLLQTKTRRFSRVVDVEEQPKFEFKARPVPDFLQVPTEFMTGSRELPHLTQPQPFQLQTQRRGQVHQAKLQAKLAEEEQEARAARHRAQLLPASTDMPVVPPKPEPKPLTVPQPFALRSEARHEEYVCEFSQHLAEEEEQRRAEAEFKARSMWRGQPYKAAPSDQPLTAPLPVKLATGARAGERQEFDKHMEEKMAAAEAEKAAAAEAARLAEEEAVREYRRSLRFKANPVPAFPPAPKPVASSKPLTKAVTPKLGRKRKQDGNE